MMTKYIDFVQVVRGPLIESVHGGAMVKVDTAGHVTGSLGDCTSAMYPRSSIKLLQAAVMVEHGLNLPPHLLALVAASHSGSDIHVDGVREILDTFNVDESSVQSTPGLPIGTQERRDYVAAGGSASSMRSDCSGKHAGMLATCVINDWDLRTYLQPDHPLQIAIKSAIARFTSNEIHTSVDGCGAPLFSMPLQVLAQIFAQSIVEPLGTPLRTVADAMRAFPVNVGGAGREATVAMSSFDGVLAKDGAEAVFAIAHPDHGAIALKIQDGSKRAIAPILAAILLSWGATLEAVSPLPSEEVLGGGRVQGRLECTPAVMEFLAL